MKLTRRDFIHAGCAASAVTLVPNFIDVAEARFPRGSALPGFNGGRSQVNLNSLQTGGDFPFLNAMKTAQQWSPLNNASTPITPDMLDANGCPTTFINTLGVNTTGVFTVFFVPTQAERPGNYVITWTGNGTVSCNMSNTAQGGTTKTGSGGSGRYVFSTTDNRFVVGISALPVTNLQVFHANDEASLLAGNVFSDNAIRSFKQRLKEANFGVIRFLNWQSGNTTNVTTWATRKPATYAFYTGYELRSALYAGITTNSGNAYSVAAPATWSGLVDKATIHILFNASATQSGTCSLNVAGTGAINILSQYAGALSGTNCYPIGGTFQSLATLVYDADLNAWIKQGGDLAIGSGGIDSGCPPELMVQLCKEDGAHPHFISPPLACTPMTDWHTQLATYCKANGPSWMIPRFEGPNELWNFAGAFFQTDYANAKATAYGWGTGGSQYMDWYGKVMSTIGQSVNAVYGGTPNIQTKYQVLCGVQTFSGSTSASNARLASTQYLTQTPQSGYTATAASGWVTHICCAQYFTPSDYGVAAEATLAASFAGKAFVASIAAGVMHVTGINASASLPLAVGDTLFDTGIFALNVIPTGVTITSLTAGTTAQTITGITSTTPAVISIASPPANGTKVYIIGASSVGIATGWYTSAGATAGTYQLMDFGGFNNVPATGTYTSGATSQAVGNFNISNSSITVASQNMTAATDLTAPNTFADTSNSGSGTFTLSACLAVYTTWKSWAQGFGVQKMCGYEGGYSPDYTSNGNSQVDMLRGASKLDANLSTFTTTNYGNFVGLTGSGFVAEFPSCFQFSGNPNLSGYSGDTWSVLEDIYQSPNPPQWTAIVAFNH